MKIFLMFMLCIFVRPTLADLGDSFAKVLFQNKVDQTYQKALTCGPLELDSKSSMNVRDWIKIQPPLPSWQMLADIEATSNDARKYARSISKNDKTRHCLAGCFIAKKLDYDSAVLVGWFKELSDASDCSKSTSFEKKDYDATIKGARDSNSSKDCEVVCKK